MAYLIRTYDKPDSAALRSATREAHLAWLEPYLEQILAGGGFLGEDDKPTSGGLIILDTDSREQAERFAADDPYARAGLFQKVEIVRWRKVIFDRQRVT